VLGQLRHAEKRYGKLKLKVHTKRYGGAEKAKASVKALVAEHRIHTVNAAHILKKADEQEEGPHAFYDVLTPPDLKIHEVAETASMKPVPFESKPTDMSDLKLKFTDEMHQKAEEAKKKKRGISNQMLVGGVKYRI